MAEDKKSAWKFNDKTLGAISGIGGVALNQIQNPLLSMQDTSAYDAELASIGNQNMVAGDSTQLMGLYNNLKLANTNNKASDFMPSVGSQVAGVGSAMAEGAAAGSVAGPWGALAGAAVGGLSSGAKLANSWIKAGRNAARDNQIARESNSRLINNLDIAADNVSENNFYNMQRNIVANGGQLFTTNGGTFNPLDIKVVNEGGTHEENPNMGVQMGVDPDGVPNLVEEGEVVSNGYVYSNRIKPINGLLEALGAYTGKIGKDMTYADIAKKTIKNLEDKPNDKISQRTTDELLRRLAMSQELQKQAQAIKQNEAQNGQMPLNLAAFGGNLFTYGGNSLVYSNNLNKRIYGSDNYRNYIITNEDGSVNWDDTYAPDSEFMKARQRLLDAINADDDESKALVERYFKGLLDNNPNSKRLKEIYNSKDKAKIHKYVEAITSDRKAGWGHDMVSLAVNNNPEDGGQPVEVVESQTPQREKATRYYTYDTDGNPVLLDDYDNWSRTNPHIIDKQDQTSEGNIDYTNIYLKTPGGQTIEVPEDNWMRFAPVAGSGVGVLASALNRPDYTFYNNIERDIYNRQPERIMSRPIGERMRYNPMDVNITYNQLAGQSAATRRALSQNANAGAISASLLAEGMSTGNNMGQAGTQVRQYNDNLFNQIQNFNRDTSKYNSQNGTQVDEFNAQNKAQYDFNTINTLLHSADRKQQIKNDYEGAIGDNMTSLFNNIGKLGRDQYDKKMTEWLLSTGWAPGVKIK